MTINNILSPPAVVREDEDRKTAQQWHEQGMRAELKRSSGTLEQSESWYFLSKDGGYADLGHPSIEDYIYKVFSKSGSTAKKYIQVYKVFVVDLKQNMDELAQIGAGRLAKVVAHVNADNVTEILNEIRTMNQQEISEKFQNTKEPSEENEDGTLRFKGPLSMVEVVQDSLRIASEELAKMTAYNDPDKVPPMMALNHVCSVFNSVADLDGNPHNTFETCLKSMENCFGVKISWEEKADNDE